MNEIVLLITYILFIVIEHITHNKKFGILASFNIILFGIYMINEKISIEEGYIYLLSGIILVIVQIKNYNT